MRYVKSSPLEVGFRIWQLRPPQPSLSIAVKGTFDPALGDPAPFADEQLPTTGEAHYEDDVEQSLRHPSDLALLKPQGECFVVGKAWAPGGRPATTVACRFRIGPIDKQFAVFGDRCWERGIISRLSATTPFREMELRLERAYGGPGFAHNPLGRGREPVDGVLSLPNLEQPGALIDSPSSKPPPVIVGPIPMSWPARMQYAGTYDQRYMRERWPWLPTDFDWRFYLAAPPDQRLREGFWRGDERVELEGLHPEVPLVRSRLPSIRPRVFLDYASPQPRFEEVPLKLDTVVWDAETGKLLCTWRGVAEVPSEQLTEIPHLFVAHDPLGGPTRSAAELRAQMERILAEEQAEEEEAEGEQPPLEATSQDGEPTASESAPEAAPEAEDAEPSSEDGELAAQMAALQAKLEAMGIPAADAPPPASEPPTPQAMIDQMRASGVDVPPELEEMVRSLSEPEPEAEAESEPAPVESPPTPEGRALVEALMSAGHPLTELDLTGADLREMDLSGQDLSGSILRQVSLTRSKLTAARLVGASLSECDLVEADLRGADMSEADVTESNLGGSDLSGATLADADFEGARLTGIRLEGVVAPRARFVAADLEGAVLRGGDFTEADFERANLRGVQATEAILKDATLEDAWLDRAVFDRAVMTGTRGEGLSAEEARFGSIDADDSFWERARLSRADFSFAKLARADFSDATLIGAEMDGCAMRQARFDRANAHSLRARKADLMEANFESADLSFADLRGANLFGAELWRANTSQIELALANVQRTKLA